jgi:hypothetical protein
LQESFHRLVTPNVHPKGGTKRTYYGKFALSTDSLSIKQKHPRQNRQTGGDPTKHATSAFQAKIGKHYGRNQWKATTKYIPAEALRCQG